MSEHIRLRRHTDGRVAVLVDPGDPNPWLVGFPSSGRTLWAEERDVSGEGWSEMLVTELPETQREATT